MPSILLSGVLLTVCEKRRSSLGELYTEEAMSWFSQGMSFHTLTNAVRPSLWRYGAPLAVLLAIGVVLIGIIPRVSASNTSDARAGSLLLRFVDNASGRVTHEGRLALWPTGKDLQSGSFYDPRDFTLLLLPTGMGAPESSGLIGICSNSTSNELRLITRSQATGHSYLLTAPSVKRDSLQRHTELGRGDCAGFDALPQHYATRRDANVQQPMKSAQAFRQEMIRKSIATDVR